MNVMRGAIWVLLVFALGLSLSSCEAIFELLGGNPLQDTVRLDVTVGFSSQAMRSGSLKVGIVDTAVPENGSIDDYLTDYYGTTFLNERTYDGTSAGVAVVFRDVPESTVTLFALTDLDSDDVYDRGEPYGTTVVTLSGDTTASIDVEVDLGTYDLSGTIDIGYGYPEGGNVRVLLYDRLPGATDTPSQTKDIAFNGTSVTVPYDFADLTEGVYHIEAFLDLDGDNVYDEGQEPYARFEDNDGNPIAVSLEADSIEDLLLEVAQTGFLFRAELSFGDESAADIIARLYTSTDTSGDPAQEMVQAYPGGPNAISIDFMNTPEGDYYLFAFLDADGDEVHDVGELYGEYPADGSTYHLYSDYTTPSIDMAQ